MRLIIMGFVVCVFMSRALAQQPFRLLDHDIVVAVDGNDGWTGGAMAPNAAGSDGPLATLSAALAKARSGRAGNQAARIIVRSGEYALKEPLTLSAADSGLTIMALPGERAIIHGSRPLTGWRETRVNGVAAWECAYSGEPFRSLFVNGQSRPRSRFPKIAPGTDGRDNFLRLESVPGLDANGPLNQPADRFVLKAGDFIARRNLGDVELVAMHLWIASRFPCASYDPASRLYVSTHRTPFKMAEGWGDGAVPARYYMDNVFEALREPGEWYLDREASKVYYVPGPGETLADARIEIGQAKQLLQIVGTAERPVAGVRLQGLTFARTDWAQPSVTGPAEEQRSGVRLATAHQAETHLPGVLELKYVRDVTVEDCEFSNLSYTAIRMDEGCSDVRFSRNHIHDLGGGGLHLNGGDAKAPEVSRTRAITVEENHIEQGGRVFHAAIGVLARHAADLVIRNNHIHDFYYSGISSGWVWGYAPSVSRNNLIEGNYIHSLGHRWLSDMGGIYMLGGQPGTVIRKNLIHDVESAQYGGWAYYFDEGSSDMRMEGNVGFRTTSQAVHLHYGRDITIVNNILAAGDESVIATSRQEPHTGLRLQRNILLTNGKPVFLGQFANKPGEPPRYVSDRNVIWDVTGAPPVIGTKAQPKPWAEWTQNGYDANSRVADPRLPDQQKLFGGVEDARRLKLTPPPDSPAKDVGFDAESLPAMLAQ